MQKRKKCYFFFFTHLLKFFKLRNKNIIMLLQGSFNPLVILYVLIATIFLWLMLWLATRFIVTKDFASRKKFMLLIVALIMVVLIPLVSGVIGTIISWPGEGLLLLRNLIPGQNVNQNYVTALVPIIIFLLFLLILKFIGGMDWKDTTWVALIAMFLLYLLYTLLPELDFIGAMSYT